MTKNFVEKLQNAYDEVKTKLEIFNAKYKSDVYAYGCVKTINVDELVIVHHRKDCSLAETNNTEMVESWSLTNSEENKW